jgi:antirestriction protein ArdC
MTFKQARDCGANVRKGERGTHVVFTKPVAFKGEDDETEKRSMLREHTVFNIAQIDGFTIAVASRAKRHPAVEALIAASTRTLATTLNNYRAQPRDFLPLASIPKSEFRAKL